MDNQDISEIINSISEEIPRIMNGTPDTDQILDTIKSLETGEQSLLLKVCSGNATSKDIDEWSKNEHINDEEINELLSMLKASFTVGEQLAKEMEQKLSDQKNEIKSIDLDITMNKDEVVAKLNEISEKIDGIKEEVEKLLNILV